MKNVHYSGNVKRDTAFYLLSSFAASPIKKQEIIPIPAVSNI
jgi:hypothetical protein